MKMYLLALAALPMMAAAQTTIPNGGFQGTWTAIKPWASTGTTTDVGTTPPDWCIANVAGYKVVIFGWMGKTQVGWQITGYESTEAVQLKNVSNSVMKSQIVPGYITLGTSWNTSVMAKENDGGSFGGKAFTGRPDALTFMYKRSHGTGSGDTYNASEPFTVVAYSWKGTTTQVDVPAAITASGTPQTCTMTNRDRNILGIPTSKGGAITYSNDFALIASINKAVSGNAADWTRYTHDFTYAVTGTAPQMINVVLSAGSYFSENGLGQDNELDVDDVQALYYSKLSDLRYNGQTLPDFDPDQYFYKVNATVDEIAAGLTYTIKGQAATAVSIINGHEVEITVTNAEGTDLEGVNSHRYFIGDATLTGLNDLDIDTATAPVEYYNLQGQRVLNPAAGQRLIRRQGTTATKVLY